MRQFDAGRVTLALGLALLLFSSTGGAEIYKWTDEDGNVHFGDKPMDAGDAEKAETVEVDEAYKPPERTEQEMRAIQERQRARSDADRRRREADEQRVAEERAAKNEQKAQMCAALDSDIEKLGSARMVNGVLNIYYLEGEDGKSISAAEQREIVAQLKAKREELGCP